QLGGSDALHVDEDRSRMNVDDMNWGLNEGEEFGMWPMLIGGFFLYISYYGCDQSQAQRSLSGKNMKEVRRALMFNGLFRFPVVVCYCLMGIVVGTLVTKDASFAAAIPADKPDYMIPIFILRFLPHGIIGLLLVAIFAAAMSSLSSAINSLSAATVEDLVFRGKKVDPEKHLKYSKMLTLFWGAVCIVLAFTAGNIADTVIEAINKVGSAFYGPIVATFILAILSKKAHWIAVNIGLLVGVLVNVIIWKSGAPIFWIWWNFIGAVITLVLGYGLSYLFKEDQAKALLDKVDLNFKTKENYILVGFFVLIILLSVNFEVLF
ncbi:MAG: sodium transporter, partial [Bacteroidia bacterium]|nr:sodium transporter [Bacteroidia bacterium]